MPINDKSETRINEFVEKLGIHGIKAIKVARSIYKVGNKKVSIRTTTKNGPKFWYDVSKSILSKVEYLIFQTTGSSDFALFSVDFFRKHYDELKDSNRSDAKHFLIDWDRKSISTKREGEISIEAQCCSLSSNVGNWAGVLQDRSAELMKQVTVDLDSIEMENETKKQLEEGLKAVRLVSFYERDSRLRHQAIDIHGTVCQACGFDFEKVYGDHGKMYIEVHHIVPISTYIEPAAVDPVKDLIVLCSNCHRMVHRKKKEPLSLSGLIKILEEKKNSTGL